MTAPRGPQRSEDRSDLTPAEARAEIEAFMGEGWRGTAWTEGDAHFVGAYPAHAAQWTLRSRESLTYRAAVDALKTAWRDAVRPWVVEAFSEGELGGIEEMSHKNDIDASEKRAAVRISRVLKEDDK